MATENVKIAKKKLDDLINKSKSFFYKPIQIAEILYKDRTEGLNLLDLESYRTKSKKWRDEITQQLLGSVSTSSARFQDNLFEPNAIPPYVLKVLGEENRSKNGIVEKYIYFSFIEKMKDVVTAATYINLAGVNGFDLNYFLNLFATNKNLRKSLDKAYEIVTYALFIALIKILQPKVVVSCEKIDEFSSEFGDFMSKILGIKTGASSSSSTTAKVYRVGSTNAADNGIDLYTNWGPAVQIKDFNLNPTVFQEIMSQISADQIVIVCNKIDNAVSVSVINHAIKSSPKRIAIVEKKDLVKWYKAVFSGEHSADISSILIDALKTEFTREFPYNGTIPPEIALRSYSHLSDPFWEVGHEI